MSTTAAAVELVEQRAESAARSGRDPRPDEALIEAIDRFGVEAERHELLLLRYWMHYAAGVVDPDEATDVTIRRWVQLQDD